jgi:hypothetical protein
MIFGTFTALPSTPPGRPSMRLLALLALLAPLAGCGSPGGGRGTPVEFTKAAARTLPAVTPPGAPTGVASRASVAPMVGPAPALQTVGVDFYVAQTFAQQCRNWGWNFCPPGTPAKPASGMDPYQFTMQSLIGMVAHAQLYTGTLVTECTGSGLTPFTVTAGSYVAGNPSPAANPTRFMLDTFDQYTCRDTNLDAPAFQTRVVSAVADGSHQSALHTRHAYAPGGSQPQTDLFQVEVVLQAGNPTFLALNFAAANNAAGSSHASRIVLLANLVTHRFALKYADPSQGGQTQARWMVAEGVGGYDLASGAKLAGTYLVRFQDAPGELTWCVDNTTAEIQVDLAPCAGVPGSWTTSAELATYLGVPAAHATRLAPFLAVFSDASPFTAADNWASPGDEELYWPAGLR